MSRAISACRWAEILATAGGNYNNPRGRQGRSGVLSSLFNYVTGALSIISFIISVTPFFPQYKAAVRFATVFFLGTLVGSLFASAQSQPIVFQFEGSLVQAMLLGAAVICGAMTIILVLAISMSDKKLDNQSSGAGASFGLFIVFMAMYSIAAYNAPVAGKVETRTPLSARGADEFLSLARYYRDQGNVNLALEYYAKALDVTYRDEQKANVQREMNAVLDRAQTK